MQGIVIKYHTDNFAELIIDHNKKLRVLKETLEKLVLQNYNIIITTKSSIDDFQINFGKIFAKQYKVTLLDEPMLKMIGMMILDYINPKDYFIKSEFEKKTYRINKEVETDDKG